MNRRKFFGLTAATVAALGLPEIVLPERQIFLPPRNGWYGNLRMREVDQYVINLDAVMRRYDAVGYRRRTGEYVQFHVNSYVPTSELDCTGRPTTADLREIARSTIAKIFERDGLTPVAPLQVGSPYQLKLPRGVDHGCYC